MGSHSATRHKWTRPALTPASKTIVQYANKKSGKPSNGVTCQLRIRCPWLMTRISPASRGFVSNSWAFLSLFMFGITIYKYFFFNSSSPKIPRLLGKFPKAKCQVHSRNPNSCGKISSVEQESLANANVKRATAQQCLYKGPLPIEMGVRCNRKKLALKQNPKTK